MVFMIGLKNLKNYKHENLLKLDKFETIKNSSHFSFLENTVEVSKIIKT